MDELAKLPPHSHAHQELLLLDTAGRAGKGSEGEGACQVARTPGNGAENSGEGCGGGEGFD